MLLREQITQDLKDAMKARNEEKRNTLRSLDSMIKNEEIAQKKRDDGLDDDGVIVLVKRALKQRKDSATQYRDGAREDLAEKEEMEIAIIEKYLPEQMSSEDVHDVVKKIITDMGATSKSDMGKVMGKVMSEIGEKSDGNIVRQAVDDMLE